MKKNLSLILFLTVLYSSNGFSKCVEGTVNCPPCMESGKVAPLKNGEKSADTLKEDQEKSASQKTANESPEEKNYLNEAKNSAVEMLVAAAAKYKAGAITKDQYIQIANQVAQMAEYANNNSNENTDQGEGYAKLAVLPPKK